MKIKFFPSSHAKNKLGYGPKIHPTRDWLVLLFLSLVLLAVGAVWNVWLFSQLQEGKSLGEVPVSTTTKVSNSLQGVQRVFQQRANEENLYQQQYHFLDPSRTTTAMPASLPTMLAPVSSSTSGAIPTSTKI